MLEKSKCPCFYKKSGLWIQFDSEFWPEADKQLFLNIAITQAIFDRLSNRSIFIFVTWLQGLTDRTSELSSGRRRFQPLRKFPLRLSPSSIIWCRRKLGGKPGAKATHFVVLQLRLVSRWASRNQKAASHGGSCILGGPFTNNFYPYISVAQNRTRSKVNHWVVRYGCNILVFIFLAGTKNSWMKIIKNM